jgi:hypothetical protein
VAVQNITSLPIAGGVPPRVSIWFNNREHSVPMYNIFTKSNQTFIQELESMDIEVTMVRLNNLSNLPFLGTRDLHFRNNATASYCDMIS